MQVVRRVKMITIKNKVYKFHQHVGNPKCCKCHREATHIEYINGLTALCDSWDCELICRLEQVKESMAELIEERHKESHKANKS